MHFEIVGEITGIETIATGARIRILPLLRRRYGRGRWRKLKGVAKLKTMPARPKHKRQFAICVRSDDPDLLTPRRIYEVLPDKSAAKSKFIRVIDNEGEDYLYPAEYFVLVEFPSAVERAWLKAS